MYECERDRQTWIKKNKERSGGKPKEEKEKKKKMEAKGKCKCPEHPKFLCHWFAFFCLLFLRLPLSQALRNYDYGDALSKSLLYFEAQRSGRLPYNQRVTWRHHSGLTDGLEQGVSTYICIYTYNHIFFPPLFFGPHITTLAMFLYRWTWSEGTMTQVTMLSLVFRWLSP